MVARDKQCRMAGSNKHSVIVATFALTALCAGCVSTLSGKLVGPGGSLVVSPEARVNITPLDVGEDSAATVVVDVDSEGAFYTRADLAPGVYSVEALVPGFKITSENVDIRKTREVELRMIPVVTPKVAPVGANVDLDVGRGAGGAELTPPQL